MPRAAVIAQMRTRSRLRALPSSRHAKMIRGRASEGQVRALLRYLAARRALPEEAFVDTRALSIADDRGRPLRRFVDRYQAQSSDAVSSPLQASKRASIHRSRRYALTRSLSSASASICGAQGRHQPANSHIPERPALPRTRWVPDSLACREAPQSACSLSDARVSVAPVKFAPACRLLEFMLWFAHHREFAKIS